MRCSAQALVTLVKAKLRFSRFPKEPELSKRAKSASCKQIGRWGHRAVWGFQELPRTLSLPTPSCHCLSLVPQGASGGTKSLGAEVTA